jgi:hypothetical protein
MQIWKGTLFETQLGFGVQLLERSLSYTFHPLPVPNAQVCVFDGTYYKITTTNYISKTSLYSTFRMYPWGMSAENLDVCTACDP